MEIYVKKILSIFSLFFWFSVVILSYTLISPMSQLQTQQMIRHKLGTQRIFNTNLCHSFAYFVLKIDEICSF